MKYACLYTSLNVCSGHKSHSETLRRSLEEIAALYNWDRPALHSPVKKVEKFVKQRNKKMLFFWEGWVVFKTRIQVLKPDSVRRVGRPTSGWETRCLFLPNCPTQRPNSDTSFRWRAGGRKWSLTRMSWTASRLK